jgi:predicted phosphoribosyltransferase
MAVDQLSQLVQRGMTDPSFVQRAQTDLDGTLAAEGIVLSPDEMAAVREFHTEIAGLSPDEVRAQLGDANRKQGAP